MKRPGEYTQCLLRKGPAEQTAWIPRHLARAGNVVTINGADDWEVIRVYQSDAAAAVESRQMDHRKQRRASDI